MSTPTPGAPTQVRFSSRAVVRTVLQVGIPTLAALGIVVPQIVDAVLSQLGEVAPTWLRAGLLGAAAAITGTAAVIARIMAIPQVEAFLRSSRFLKWLAAEPRPVPAVDVDPEATADPETADSSSPSLGDGVGDAVRGVTDGIYGGDSKTHATFHKGGYTGRGQ